MPVIQADRASAITPNDSTLFTQETALYIGTGGDVAVNMWGTNETVTFSNIPSGTFMPILVDKVLSTGTTASNIIGLTKQ
jgi:hypothetical protein